MDHTHCTCGAVIPECPRLHVDDVDWDSLTVADEPVVVTEEVTVEEEPSHAEDETVDVDVDVDVHVGEESSSEEESSREEESREEESRHEEDEGEEGEPSDAEVVIEEDTGVPDLPAEEERRDRAHDLPMRRR